MMSKKDVQGNWRTIRGRKVFVKDANGEASISKGEFNEHHAGYQPSGSEHRKQGMVAEAKERLASYKNIQAPKGEDTATFRKELLTQFVNDRFKYEPRADRDSVMNEVLQEASPGDGLAQQAYETLKPNGHYDPRFETGDNFVASAKQVTPAGRATMYTNESLQVRKRIEQAQGQYPKDQPHVFREAGNLAETLAKGDPDTFMTIMDNTLIPPGKSQAYDTQVRDIKWVEDTNKARPIIGSTGLAGSYNDRSNNQISNHFWGFVSAGYHKGTGFGYASNFKHEYIDPMLGEVKPSDYPQSKGSQQDWDLSVQAYKLGNDLKQKKITVKQFNQRAENLLKGKEAYPKDFSPIPFKL